jgi:phosphatidylglycerol phospholipase C
MRFATLVSRDGQAFIAECKRAGKAVVVWTVNSRNDMIAATQWGVDVLISDRTGDAIQLRDEMRGAWTRWTCVDRRV